MPRTSKINLLVTGGAGFIGSNLIRHIIAKKEIARLVNLDCLTYAGNLENLREVSSHPKYFFEKADIRDKATVSKIFKKHKITHVIHLAAESHVDRSISGPADFIETNIIGTFNLLEVCREAWKGKYNRTRFHHVSTDEVYGSLGRKGSFSESTAYAPNSPYSASKAGSDFLVRAYNRTYGLNTIITSCSNNYGPYQHAEKFIPTIIRSILARKPIPIYGKGKNVRDWLFVGDHAEAIWQVFLNGKSGETYNIGGNNGRTNIQLVTKICAILDEMAPELGGNSKSLITFVKDRAGHDERYAINSAKIKKEIGWKPFFSFEQGLRKTVRWYMENANYLINRK